MNPIQVMTVTVGANAATNQDPLVSRAAERLKGAAFEVIHERAIGTDPTIVQQLVQRFAGELDAIIVLGGEQTSPRSIVPEALQKLFEKDLPGFGERFRAALAQSETGARAAITDRATAGILSGCAVFVLPHSDAGVDIGITQLIVPALPALAVSLRS